MEKDNEVYYRIYLGKSDEIVIVCLQRFDEHDYNQSRFLSEQRFISEEIANEFIRTIQNSNRYFPRVIEDALDNYRKEEDFMYIFDRMG